MNLELRKTFVLAFLSICCCCGSASAQMNGEAAHDWAVVFRDTLQYDVLQFWIDHAVDKEYGGLFGRLDRQGRPTDYGNDLPPWIRTE